MENLYPLQNHHIVICERTGELRHNDSWLSREEAKKSDVRARELLKNSKTKKKMIYLWQTQKLSLEKLQIQLRGLKMSNSSGAARKKCVESFFTRAHMKNFIHTRLSTEVDISLHQDGHESLLKRHKKIVAMRQNKKNAVYGG